MTEEQLKQIFVPFFTSKPRGTGLGLSLTQRILNEHGAQIECASALGKGTTFTVHFPLK
jgi:signal transduction histidine kinase